MKQKIIRRKYKQEFRVAAVARAAQIGLSAAAKELGVPRDTLDHWNRLANPKPQAELRTQRSYSADFKASAILLAKEIGYKAAAAQLDMPPGTLNVWRLADLPDDQKRKVSHYTKEERERACAHADKVGWIRAAVDLGVKESTLRNWRKARAGSLSRAKPRRFSAEYKNQALERLKAVGVEQTVRELGVSVKLLRGWARQAGLIWQRKIGLGVDADPSLGWIERDYPELEAWRVLAVSWLKGEKRSIRTKLLSLRLFFKRFIAECGLPADPSVTLARTTVLPEFFSTACANSSGGVTANNYVHQFVDWVLKTEFSEPDDFGRPIVVALYHNPIARRTQRGLPRPEESVYSPLPYGYIDELRGMLAQGPNFRDWIWARGVLGSEAGEQGGSVAPDWFEVSEDLIDRDDPDCVFRTRLRSQKTGGLITEMWSPVRWVALLTKLILPLRTFQVRLLDSGESDTWRYDHTSGKACWSLNTHHLRQGTERETYRNGVFRRPAESASANVAGTKNTLQPDVLLYINTNKTGDLRVSHEKGYSLPWSGSGALHSNPFYWLAKLRNWQEKYNPVQSRTSWKTLDGRHIMKKSDIQLATYPDSCFLFRMAEGKVGETNLPIYEGALDRPWFCLLSALEGRLKARKEYHADGSAIQLTFAGSEKRTYFPLHSLRVSLITALALEGQIPFPILQKLVGHSRLLMTLYYTKPGAAYTLEKLQEALANLESNKEQGIIQYLKSTNFDRLVNEAICNSTTSLRCAVPEHEGSRNPAGWMPMHIGLCLVGGNTTATEGNSSLGGCHNGGANIGTESNPKYAPVPGGSRNCVRCRWFVTSVHFLPALVAHFNNIMFHFDEARTACLEADRKLNGLKQSRIAAEDAFEPFLLGEELRNTERRWETLMQRFDERAQDAAACVRLALRCLDQLPQLDGESGASDSLIAVGTTSDIRLAVEETDSELLQLCGVCESAEIYPDLDPGKAVFRRSQLLDAALHREGLPPILMALTEDEQLRIGNEMVRRLSRAKNASNPSVGRREVIDLMDAKKGLAEQLGIDLREVFGAGTVQQVPIPVLRLPLEV